MVTKSGYSLDVISTFNAMAGIIEEEDATDECDFSLFYDRFTTVLRPFYG